MLAPVIDEIAEKYETTLKVVTVDIDEEPTLATMYQVKGIPATFLIKEGVVETMLTGGRSFAQLDREVKVLMEFNEGSLPMAQCGE